VEQQREPGPLILTGMHRSGTSLAASIVRAAGINMGQRFSAPDVWSQRGYYEDHDFLELHRSMLRSLGECDKGWTLRYPLNLAREWSQCARKLVGEKSVAVNVWGWKDPRTCLFLEFWHAICPNAVFLFVYRPRWEVVYSLLRRGLSIETLSSPTAALQLWIHYNLRILEFARSHPERTLLISMRGLALDAKAMVGRIGELLRTRLCESVHDCFDANLIHSHDQEWRASLIADGFPEARRIFQLLNEMALLKDKEWPQRDSPSKRQELCEKCFVEWALFRTAENKAGRLKRKCRFPSPRA
jgi:hypothetical protein